MKILAPRDALPPFTPFDWLRTEMDRLFDHAMPSRTDAYAPRLTLHETESGYEVRLPIAGAEPDGLDVDVDGGVLRLSGARAGVPPDAERRYAVERHTGRFARALRLPPDVDAGAVEARYRDGILVVTLPKAEEARPRRISVQV